MPANSIYLMLAGGFATCIAQASWRLDARWALALGVPFLLSAECAGVPASLIAWGLVAWSAGAALFLVVMLARTLEVRLSTALGLIAAAAMLTGPADAVRRMGPVSLHRPPPPAVTVEAMLRTLVEAQ